MDKTLIAVAIIGVLGVVFGAIISVVGAVILKRMAVVAEAQAKATEVAALAAAAAAARDVKIEEIGDGVKVLKVEVDGKLKEILQLNRDLQFAQGEKAGRLEEIANAQALLAQNQSAPVTVSVDALAAALPEALAVALPAVIPQILPDLIGKVVESKVVGVKDEEPPK